MLFMNNQSLTQEFPLDKLNFIQTQILDGRVPLLELYGLKYNLA